MAARQALALALIMALFIGACATYSFWDLGRLLIAKASIPDAITTNIRQEYLSVVDIATLKREIHLFFLEHKINIATTNIVLDQAGEVASEEGKLIIFLMRKVCRPAKLYIWASAHVRLPFIGSFDQPWCLTF